MAYEIDVYPEADAQRATLPAPALVLYGQVLDVLQLTPWNGRSAQPSNPGGAGTAGARSPAPSNR